MSLLFYKRPDYVDKQTAPMDSLEYQQYLEKSRATIPAELCFENVIANRALPPCSLHDFMGYLLYVAHDAENLQFFLWLQDYTNRFYSASREEQALSPLWDEDAVSSNLSNEPKNWDRKFPQMIQYKIDFDSKHVPQDSTTDKQSFASGSNTSNPIASVDYANAQTGLKWQSFTIQPFRSEINRVISHYLAPGSPRELNLSHKNRAACLHALQHTTHPSAFAIPNNIVNDTLRNQSHPNFIRWATINGNKPRIIFGRTLGALNILFGFIIAIVLTLSVKSRWWRLFAALAWLIGFNCLLAGSNGICLVLYATRGRHLKPWEQFNNGSVISQTISDESELVTLAGSDAYSMNQGSGRKRHVALEAFGTANSYGHEVWVEKYCAKMMVRKIFDTTVWVQNESVRIMQDKVALQSLLWSIIVTVPLTILFTALPVGKYY